MARRGLGLILSTALMVCGCVDIPMSAQEAESRAQIEKTRPTCSGESDCHVKWEAAQLWVAKNAGLKIQTATDVVIETFNATEYSTGLAVQATKEPQGGGVYLIVAHAQCSNTCNEDPVQAMLDFNKSVAAAKP